MARKKAGKRRRRRPELTDEQRVAATISTLKFEDRLGARIERRRLEWKELIEGPPLDPPRAICELSNFEQCELRKINANRSPATQRSQLPASSYEARNLMCYIPKEVTDDPDVSRRPPLSPAAEELEEAPRPRPAP